MKNAPFSVKQSSTGGVSVVLGDKEYSPEEVSAMVLRKLKEDAEARLGGSVTEAVITVPAYFNDAQRKATKDAGKIAGLEVKRIINEPTAAALAYGFDKKKNEKIVVFDFGGGTFDVSVLQVGDDVVEVKSTGGDSHLGGRDIDREVLNYVIAEYKKESGVDLSGDSLAVQRLDEEVERGEKRIVAVARDRNQHSVYHFHLRRAAAPVDQTDTGKAGGAGKTIHRQNNRHHKRGAV